MTQPKEGTTALAGVRVVEAGRYIAAPFCGIILADLGAEVIKLEEPGRGDETRNVAPYHDGESIYFVAHNRNKGSITLDMRKPEANGIMKDIARNCDIFIENFRPGVMQEMGVGYDELSKANPALVFVSISGFGQSGPYASRPGFEQIAQAVGGMMHVTGFPENPPVLAGAFVGDYIGGLYGAIGALAALNQARATGKGQWVDAGLLDGVVSLLGYHMGVFKCTGQQWGRYGNTLHFSAPLGIYPTKEGYVYINVGADNLFRRFARTIGQPGLPDDERFKDRQARIKRRAELDGIVSAWTSVRSADEVVKVLNDAALPCGPVNDLAGVAEDPQVVARDLLLEVEQGSGVKMPVIGRALKMSESPAHIGRAPVLGETNDEFYGNLLGYDAKKLAQLKELGVI